MDGLTPLPRRECTDSHWGGCVPPSSTGNWGDGRSTVRVLGRGLGSSQTHICVCTPTLSECLHPLVFTWQLPSSPAGGNCPLSPMGKGTKQEFRCLSSALLPQVGPWGEELGSEAAPQALLQEGSPPPGAISSAGPRAEEKGRVLEDPSEKGSGRRQPGRPSPAACKRNGSQ